MPRVVRALLILGWSVTGTGCVGFVEARYVYQDGYFGVVGIPSNTTTWPRDYRAQAEALMKAHFPDGYEIVRAEEVIEGVRTLVLDGKTTAQVSPTLPAPLPAVGGLSLGRTASRTQSDSVKIKECRIVYKRAGSLDPEPGFSADPEVSPARYRDPDGVVGQTDSSRVVETSPQATSSPQELRPR
jgi:hypothetical protein